MGREHYACRVRWGRVDHFVVWYDDDRDGFVRRPDDRLVTAPTLAELTAVAAGAGVVLARPDVWADYDFDAIAEWCRRPDPVAVDCPDFLNAWNFLDDLARLHERRDTPYAAFSRAAARCYDKLFWGNNLPAVTPKGRRYVPRWLPGELEAIRRVMERGIVLLRVALSP